MPGRGSTKKGEGNKTIQTFSGGRPNWFALKLSTKKPALVIWFGGEKIPGSTAHAGIAAQKAVGGLALGWTSIETGRKASTEVDCYLASSAQVLGTKKPAIEVKHRRKGQGGGADKEVCKGALQKVLIINSEK